MSYPAGANQLSAVTTGAKVVRSFGYDAAGNLASDNRGADAFAFSYDVRNRPVAVTVTRSGGASETSRYQYNALEQMVSRSTTAAGGPKGMVHYIYGLDGALLAEADGTTGVILRDDIWLPAETPRGPAEADAAPVLAAPLPLALVTGVNTPSPGLLMVHTDHLGRPIRLTDATRATVWQAAYQPFGELMSIAGTVEQNLRFPGQYFLLETGLAYNWHRHYDATTGRYTQPDPLRFVDGPSVYAYAGASPVMVLDPAGLVLYPSDFIGPIRPTDCYSPPIAPPGADVDANMKEAGDMWPNALEFRDSVKNKGPWDYKQQGKQYEEFGNYNYGATGNSFGFTKSFLLQQAGEAQIAAGTSQPDWIRKTRGNLLPPYGDDPRDQEMIKRGIEYSKNGGKAGCSCK